MRWNLSSDVRSARAAGAADVGRSNVRGTVEGASAGGRGMVDDGSNRVDAWEVAKRKHVRWLREVGIDGRVRRRGARDRSERPGMLKLGKGVSNLRSVTSCPTGASRWD